MTLRDMTPADVPACAAIVGSLPFFEDYGYGEQAAERDLRAALDDHRSVLTVAGASDGDRAGFSWIVRRGAFDRSDYLRLIAVSPAHARSGLGRRLIDRARTATRELFLLVTATNPSAVAFYEALGFEHCGSLPDYVRPGETEQIYRWNAPA